MIPFEWVCPYCLRHQMVGDDNYHANFTPIYSGESVLGKVGVAMNATRCLNPECNQLTLRSSLWSTKMVGNNRVGDKLLNGWPLLPQGSSKPQPDYIPKPIKEDYFEACLIKDLSPKASATLARRCLQGMLRDFCGIAKGRLIDEIKELRKQVNEGSAPKGVESETVDAIDSIREIGNIGAHMEKDISLIVDVDPGEAQALIELIEMLFEEWYVARHTRQQKLDKIKAVAADKQAILAAHKAEKAHAAIAAPGGQESTSEGTDGV